MLVADYNILPKAIACLLTGIVVKLIDDYIDADNHIIENKRYKIDELENAIILYSLIFLAIAAGFHSEYAITLLSSCYIVGMFYDLNLKLPTGLRGYQESILIIIINIYLFSIQSMITSLLVIILLQIIDDIYDMEWDRKYGFKNYANRFGKVEMIIISLIIVILLVIANFIKLVIVIFCAILVNLLHRRWVNISMNY